MDSGRQLLRYGFPGSLAVFAFCVSELTLQLFWGRSVDQFAPLGQGAVAFLVAAASLPIGFALYQLYHWSEGPFIFGTRVVTRDLGGQVLSTLSDSQRDELARMFNVVINVTRLHRRMPADAADWRVRLGGWLGLMEVNVALALAQRTAAASAGPESTDRAWSTEELQLAAKFYVEQWNTNRNVLDSLLDIVASHSGGVELKHEYTGLSDIYHGLGASRTTIAAGWMAAVSYALLIQHTALLDHPLKSVAAILITALSVGTFGLAFHRGRARIWHRMSSRLGLGLRAYFFRHADWQEDPEVPSESPD
jgi:hypothetical protein